VQNLPGLTPVWLIVLSAILAFLVALAGEAFQRGLYEFLRDFQPSIIGALALGTAVWAAKPVFGQLQAARRQAAVVAYEALSEIQASLTAERLFMDDVDQIIFSITFLEEQVQTAVSVGQGPQWDPGNWSEGFDENRRKLVKLSRDFRGMPRRPWGSAAVQTLRRDLGGEFSRYGLRIRVCGYKIKTLNTELLAGRLAWNDLHGCRGKLDEAEVNRLRT